MSRPIHPRATQKTYSHLLGARRMPTDYELLSTDLLYYVPRGGFEVATPVGDFYAKNQRESPLVCATWDAFRDPRATTYTSYTALQQSREGFVDGMFRSLERGDYETSLASDWTTTLAASLFPLRYPWHAFGMAAAYVGQMAPGGRVTIAALFQSADEMRRIERVAYRMALFDRARPLDPDEPMHMWMHDPRWQPLRETCERLLVTYDFGEAFVALNLCVKPALDEALSALARMAKSRGDYVLGEVLGSFEEDAEWQRSWTRALVTHLVSERPDNGDVIAKWSQKWRPRALSAASGFQSTFGATDDGALDSRLRKMIDEAPR